MKIYITASLIALLAVLAHDPAQAQSKSKKGALAAKPEARAVKLGPSREKSDNEEETSQAKQSAKPASKKQEDALKGTSASPAAAPSSDKKEEEAVPKQPK